MGAYQWKTSTRALLCARAMEPRPKPLRKRSPGKPSITCPTLLGHLRGFGLRQSVSSSSPTPAVRQAPRLTRACSRQEKPEARGLEKLHETRCCDPVGEN